MRRAWFFLAIFAVFTCRADIVFAQTGGGGEIPVPTDKASAEIAEIHPRVVARAAAMGFPVLRSDSPEATGSLGQFQYPVRSSRTDLGPHSVAISGHVDLDPTAGIRDFACGYRSYDGHQGTDIYLWPFIWTSMDRKEASVVSALGGVIVAKQDGNFDRQCTWVDAGPANYVVVRHDNGLLGYYWHFKKGTVTTKPVGARVAVGELLGYIGSSGRSTGPHLHFEVRGSDDKVIEPSAGACNSRAASWTHQAATLDTLVNDLLTHSQPPSFVRCVDPVPHIKNRFLRGETIYAVAYFRDQPAGRTAQLSIIDPSGVVRNSWVTGSPTSGFWTSSYWWLSYTVPPSALAGVWRVRAVIGTSTMERAFTVVTTLPAASVAIAVANPVRSLAPGATAIFNVTVQNASAQAAVGCRLTLDRPIRADVFVSHAQAQVLSNRIFTVPARGQSLVRLNVKARAGFAAKNAIFPVKATCTNTPTAISAAANGRLVLSSP